MIDNNDLLSAEGFYNAYLRKTFVYNTQIESYEALEVEFLNLFGKRRYSNWESFKRVKERFRRISIK